MGRIVGLALAALLVGAVVALALFPDLRARLRRPSPGRAVAGPANPVLVGATGYLGYLRDGDGYVVDIALGSTQRATRSGGVSLLRVAPSGNFVSFARNNRLFVAKSDGTAEFEMAEGDQPESARWASHNVALVYSSKSGSLQVFDPRAGQFGQRMIDPPGSGVGPNVAWSSSGARIAYERRKPVSSTVTRDGIWIVNTSHSTPVSSPIFMSSGQVGLRLCCWSSNDQYVLFWQVALDGEGLATVGRLLIAESDGSEPVEVSASTLLLPGIVGHGGIGQVVPLIEGGSRQWGDAKTLVATQPGSAPAGNLIVRRGVLEDSDRLSPGSPSISLDGTQVAFSIGPSLASVGGDPVQPMVGRRIWIVGVDGKRKRSLLADATVPRGVSDDLPKWSRDGRTIVFARRLSPGAQSGSAGRSGQLEAWVAYADGSNARRLIGNLEDPGVNGSGTIDYGVSFDYQP